MLILITTLATFVKTHHPAYCLARQLSNKERMIYWTAFSLPYNIALKRRMPSSVDTPYIQYQWDRRVNSLSRKRSPHFKRWNDFPILYCMIIRRCQSIAILSDQNVIFLFLPSKAATRTKCDWFCFCHQIILHLTSFRIANVLKTKK